MKRLNHYISEAERIPCLHGYITEKFRLSRDNIQSNLVPKNFSELQHIISDKIGESNILDMNNVDISNIKNLSNAFSSWNIVEVDVSDWDISHVTNLSAMFGGCKYLRKVIGLENWDISNVKSMAFMFNNCRSLIDIGDISNWNITEDIDLKCMFQGCERLKTIGDITKWKCKNPNWEIFPFTDIKPLPQNKV